MFQFLRPKRTQFGPVDFHDAIIIEQPAETVYALLDWASPRNVYRARGGHVAQIESEADRFRLVVTEIPDVTFEMTVTAAVPHSAYSFMTVATPKLGRMVGAHEQYSLEALGPGSCRLRLVNTITFVRMRPEEFGQEQLMVSAACHNALAKLKIQAEQGVEALKAVDAKLVV
jgi:hypothetical protein